MLAIRLSRVGKKKAPIYRVVVMPKTRDPWAKNIEILGHYNPRKQPKEFIVDTDRIKQWLKDGAEASDTVWNLLIEHKIIEGEKHTVTHISKKRHATMEKTIIENKAKVEAVRAKAEAAKLAEIEAKKVAEETAKAEAEAVKEAIKIETETPTPVVEDAAGETLVE